MSSNVTTKSYVTGFILALILTVIPFYMVMSGSFSKEVVIPTILILALIQLVVHLIFFLHMGFSPEQKETALSFIFTAVIVGLLLVGSIWIMFHLDANMARLNPADYNTGGM